MPESKNRLRSSHETDANLHVKACFYMTVSYRYLDPFGEKEFSRKQIVCSFCLWGMLKVFVYP